MRFPVHPPPIKLGNSEFSHLQFVELLLSGKQFNETGAGIRSAVRIEQAVKASQVGDHYELSETDWKWLAAEAEAPSQGYPVATAVSDSGQTQKYRLGALLLPHIDAIVTAEEKPPAPPGAPAPDKP